MLRAFLTLALVVMAGLPLAFAPAADAEPALSFRTLALPSFGGEPNLDVAADGAVYVVHPSWPASQVYRLAAGAAAFEDLGRPNVGLGGADEDIAVGPDGLVAVVGMYPGPNGLCTSVTMSHDAGDSWLPPIPAVCAPVAVDRPFVAIGADRKVWVVQHAYCCTGQHSVHVSLDEGATFLPSGLSTLAGDFPGNVLEKDGRLYATTTCRDLLVCMTSTTSLLPQPAWIPHGGVRMIQPAPGLGHSTGAVDDAGNLYVSWVEPRSNTNHVYVARSTDLGLTWSAPERVSGGSTAVMPWIVAGADGHVAVAWYEADARGDPNGVPATAAWVPRVAVRQGWGETWQHGALSATPNHEGPLCTHGAACYGMGIDRDLLDYFEIAIGPDGRLHAVWSDDVAWRVMYAEQTGGPLLR